MKYIIALITLLISVPLVGMDKGIHQKNACMLYSCSPALNNHHALMQSGLMVSSFIVNHPKVAPVLNKAATEARKGAFIIPALIAYNSENIKNSIMYQLPEFNTYVDTCLDKGVQKTLFYGGIALAGYLFYTETLGYLTQGALTRIFKPLKLQSSNLKKLAGQDHVDTLTIDTQVDQLAMQAKKTVDQLVAWQEQSEEKHKLLASKTNTLKSIEQSNGQAILQLQQLIEQINIPQLTQAVQDIAKGCESHKQIFQEVIAKTHEAIKKHNLQLTTQVKQAVQQHKSRASTIQVVATELSRDVDAFFNKIITLANSVYTTRARINYALELAEKMDTQIKELDDLSDSGSETSEVSDSEDDSDFPRGQGGSR